MFVGGRNMNRFFISKTKIMPVSFLIANLFIILVVSGCGDINANHTELITSELTTTTFTNKTKIVQTETIIESKALSEELPIQKESIETSLQIPTEQSNTQELILPDFKVSRVSTRILRAKDGVIYTVPDKDDIQKSVDSMDHKTGQPTYKLTYNVYSKEKSTIDNSQKITKKISFDYEGVNVEFNVSYVEKGNTKVFLPESNRDSFIIDSIKSSDKAILEYDNDLFYVDVEKNIVTPMLNDDCGAYSKESLKELAKSYRSEKSIENEGYYLVWGRHSEISRDGTKMVFLSNRNGLLGDSDQYGTWLKDLQTGEEKLLLHGDKDEFGLKNIGCYGSNCLGWDEQGFVYFSGFGNVIKVNPETEEIKLVTTDASIARLAKNYIVSHSREEVKIYDTVKDTVQFIKPEADNVSNIYSSSPNGNYFAFSYQSRPISFHRNLGIIDLNGFETHYINIPDTIILDGFSWIDNNQFLINYYFPNNKDKKESMFIDLNF
jgi:hypothetical protein